MSAYSESQALVEFQSGLKMVFELLDFESKYADPPPPNEVGIVSGLRGGAVVLLVAVFEGYLRDVIPERVDTIKNRKVAFSRLPESMQVHAVYALLERELKGDPYSNVKPTKFDRLPSIKTAATLVGNSSFRADVFGDTRSNPNSDTVIQLLKNVGIEAPMEKLQKKYELHIKIPVPKRFVKDKLNEIVQRRHAVAHTGSVSNVGRKDLMESPVFIQTLANLIDLLLHTSFDSIS